MQNEKKKEKVLKNNVLPYRLAEYVKYDIEGQGY